VVAESVARLAANRAHRLKDEAQTRIGTMEKRRYDMISPTRHFVNIKKHLFRR
jgi:hypothetical protein